MNTDKIYAESIAKEYAPKDKSKIIALRKLDAKAKLPATIFTYTFGVISTLVLGTGMCLWRYFYTCIGYGNVPFYASHWRQYGTWYYNWHYRYDWMWRELSCLHQNA